MRNPIRSPKVRELGWRTVVTIVCFCLAGMTSLPAAVAYQTEVLYGDGFIHADKAYAYFAQGQYAATEREVQAALRYYPAHPRLLLLLAQAVERQGDTATALRLLTDLNANHPGFAQALAIRGYFHAKLADHIAAVQYFQLALNSADNENVDREGLRVNLIDSAMRSKQPKLAADYLQPEDPAPLRIQLVRQLIEANDNQTALKVLETVPASGISRVAQAELLFLRGSILEQTGQTAAALATFDEVLKLVATGESPYLKSESLWKLAEAAERRGDVGQALKLGDDSVRALPDNTIRRLQFAYMAKRHKQDRIAAEHMEYAIRLDPNIPLAVLQDAAYSLKRLGENKKAMHYFERSLDKQIKPESLPAAQQQKAIELNYDLRREHETLEKTWGMYTSFTYWRPTVGDAVLQGSQEFFWQPYNRNGRKLLVFNRYYGNIWSQAPDAKGPYDWSPTVASSGWSTAQGGIGISWKPLTDANLVLTAEKLFPAGQQGINDWLYRVGYSWDRGYEFKPYVKSWPYVTVYAEYDQWASSGRQIFGMETRWGHSTRLGERSSRAVFTPHLFFTASYDSGYDDNGGQTRLAMAAGPGFVYRKWYREDKYNAPRSYWDLTVQYRLNLGVRRIDGLLVQWFNSF